MKFDNILRRIGEKARLGGDVISSLSVEPAALLMMTSTLMSHLVFINFLMDRICRTDLALGDGVCDSLAAVNGSYREEELEIQMQAATFRSYRSLLENSFPILVLLFLGAWSDLHGRKVPMLLGISSVIVQDLLMVVCALSEGIGGLTLSLIVVIPGCCTGSLKTFGMAAYSHISDTSTHSLRTVRFGLLSAASSLGVPLGFALGGRLLKAKIGFPAAFLVSATLSVVAVIIVFFRVDSSKPKVVKEEGSEDHGKENTGASVNVLSRLVLLVKGMISVLVKRRPESGRTKLWLLLLVYICVAVPIHGEFGIMYLFLRARLGWDSGDYGVFSIYNSLISGLGVVLSMGIFSHWAQLPDPVVGFIAGIGQFSACFVYVFATTSGLMYLAPAIDMMNGTMWVVAKAMVSKVVGVEEYGRTFTVFGLISALVPLAADPAYAFLYKATVSSSLPGAVFLLSAALTIPPQTIYAAFSWRTIGWSSWDIETTTSCKP
ncbi:solute carrier family 46 member 3 [Folsomia candida]|uniref:solute carrier family 46 member 3 n=1 Tax=Folsomia candida TaxID=158441 RepID=UPI00160532B2|nr:solute carrier family 46 member 3 [Folsomia candida]